MNGWMGTRKWDGRREKEKEGRAEITNRTWIKLHFHAISYRSHSQWLWKYIHLMLPVDFASQWTQSVSRTEFFRSKMPIFSSFTFRVGECRVARIYYDNSNWCLFSQDNWTSCLFRSFTAQSVGFTIDWNEFGVTAPSHTTTSHAIYSKYKGHVEFDSSFVRSRGVSSECVRQKEIDRCIASSTQFRPLHTPPIVLKYTPDILVSSLKIDRQRVNDFIAENGDTNTRRWNMEKKKISSKFRVFVLAAFACVVFFFRVH